jgi:hypothetical protein
MKNDIVLTNATSTVAVGSVGSVGQSLQTAAVSDAMTGTGTNADTTSNQLWFAAAGAIVFFIILGYILSRVKHWLKQRNSGEIIDVSSHVDEGGGND